VADDQVGRGLTGRLFGWARGAEGDRRDEKPGQQLPTKALGRFLSALASRELPVVLDLGPIVGPNVGFLGERLGCKLIVENILADLDRFVRDGRLAEFPAFLDTRFAQEAASVDGVLCWDVIDFLDKRSAQALGRQLARVLKPGGALLGFFASTVPARPAPAQYSKFLIVDDKTLERRVYPGAQPQQPVLNSRDIGRLFEGMRVAESFLLLSKTRELLFRKPA
jgi:hypothetical protein